MNLGWINVWSGITAWPHPALRHYIATVEADAAYPFNSISIPISWPVLANVELFFLNLGFVTVLLLFKVFGYLICVGTQNNFKLQEKVNVLFFQIKD